MSPLGVVAVFGSSGTLPDTSEWAEAEEVGARLGDSGLAVITGGYGGTMEAVSKGAARTGAAVIGVIAPRLFPDRPGANRYVTELIEADDLVGRIGVMMGRADAIITLPGSIGTAAELVIAWNLNYIARQNGGPVLPIVAVGPGWRSVARALIEDTGADGVDVHLVDTAGEAVSWLLPRLNIT